MPLQPQDAQTLSQNRIENNSTENEQFENNSSNIPETITRPSKFPQCDQIKNNCEQMQPENKQLLLNVLAFVGIISIVVGILIVTLMAIDVTNDTEFLSVFGTKWTDGFFQVDRLRRLMALKDV
jgi:hypothetical protein